MQVEESEEGRILTISVGPQHPGSGHFRLVVKVDGDIIVGADPDPGYVHRGEEKMCEYRNYIQNIPHLERPMIADSCGILYPFCLGVEEIANIPVPERAKYIRVIMAELNRCIFELYWLGIYGIFLGHSTMFMWPMGDRELLIDLAEAATGARVTHAYFVPGGVRNDLPENFKERAFRQLDYFKHRLDQYKDIFYNNPLFLDRTKGVGVLSAQDAINLGVTGPVLRASGVKHDIRKIEPYDVYDQLDFEVYSMNTGDSYARAYVPLLEMYESINIIKQCLEKLPSGSVRTKLGPNPRGPAGEVFKRVEAGRGELAYYLVSDGTAKPYRVKMSVPSFRQIPAMSYLLKGARLADMPAIYWSLNYWPVEADR
ncbi:MAG: NADH-quinone oxidoreductase subunit D [Candidatus Nitrosomirales archaeon]|jgi:NADH-quinone oxidoreductase subunit D